MKRQRILLATVLGEPLSLLGYRFLSDVSPYQWCLVYFVSAQLVIAGLCGAVLVGIARHSRRPGS